MPVGRKKTLGDFYFESGCHDNTTPHNKKADDTTFSRLGTWKQNFFQRQACFKNWQHWSSTTIPSIWHLSVGGLRVGLISSTGAYGAMSLLLLILRDSIQKTESCDSCLVILNLSLSDDEKLHMILEQCSEDSFQCLIRGATFAHMKSIDMSAT